MSTTITTTMITKATIIITMAISYLIGVPVLRLKGHYLAMATLGFGTILYRIFLGTRVFGEADDFG